MEATMKKIIVIGILIGGVITAILSMNSGYTQFIPIKIQAGTQTHLVHAPELLNTPGYIENILLVFNFYDENYEVKPDGKILISKKLSRDEELLWNYCKKAADPVAIEELRRQGAK
jgi:hypothetical protein